MSVLTGSLGLAWALSATLAVAATGVTTPAPTPAPSVVPVRLMPGETLKIDNVSCGANRTAVFVLDNNLKLNSVGSGTSWSATLPANLQAQKIYSVKLECTPVDPKDTPAQVAVLEVLPLSPTVTAVFPAGGKPGPGTLQFELKGRLNVEIRDLKPWREQSPANAAAELHLFLADMELKNLAMASAGEVRDATGRWSSTMTVTLDLDDKDSAKRKPWIQVLQSATDDKDVKTSVGPAGGPPFASDAKIRLRVFPWYTWIVVMGMIGVAVLLIVFGKKSNLLRDVNGAANPPYSLARHQMALWFVVIVGGYLYVWLITGSAALSSTALILMGISGATGLAAIVVDNNKQEEQAKKRMSLPAEQVSLNGVINDPGGLRAQLNAAAPGSPPALEVAAALQTKVARLAEVNALLAAPAPAPAQNRRWYLDLLSDENGISFHRLQMAIWTIVLVGVFVRAVYTDVMMPDFDATMLGLMGIASGTYIGFKFPEKK